MVFEQVPLIHPYSPCVKAFSLCPLMLQKWAVR
jgi:hypothetical protein